MLQVFYQYSDLSGTLCLKVIQSLKLMQILPESKWHFPLPANLSQANDLLKIITKKLFYFMWSEFLYIFYKLLYYPAELLMGSGKQFSSFPWIFADQCTHQLWKRRDFFLPKYVIQVQADLLLFSDQLSMFRLVRIKWSTEPLNYLRLQEAECSVPTIANEPYRGQESTHEF